jgi:hypothetical protein
MKFERVAGRSFSKMVAVCGTAGATTPFAAAQGAVRACIRVSQAERQAPVQALVDRIVASWRRHGQRHFTNG